MTFRTTRTGSDRPVAGAAVIAAAIAGFAGGAWAADPVPGLDQIRTHTLDNGLKLIVWPDHDIPNVALYNWVRAGGRNEVPGVTGLSHFFEHMMFNGTSTRAPGEFDRIMEAAGGRNNAYTSNDVTVYQDWFPTSALEIVFDLEADRISNLSFDPDVVESERGVVQSERRSSVDNDNSGRLYEQTQATAFIAHPYQFPVIGWPSDIAAWTMDDLKAFFKTYYAPNNLTMIVAGDVDPDEVFALAERWFGSIPAQAPPPEVRTVEPEQRGERRLVIRRDVSTPLMQLAYRSGRAADEDSAAMDLLMNIAVGGDSSRLHRRLVEEEQAAVSIGGFRHKGFDPGLTWLFATLPEGGDVERVQALIDAEMGRLASEGPTAAELTKARNIVLADFWRTLSTINGKASALGSYQVFHGDYRKLFDAPSRYGAVTIEDVRAAAARVFRADQRTVGLMLPEVDQEAGS